MSLFTDTKNIDDLSSAAINWSFYTEFNLPDYEVVSIDTRDFYATNCAISDFVHEHDIKQLLSVPIAKYAKRFVVDADQLRAIVDNLFVDSGGKKDWRCLTLKHDHPSVNGWSLKYIRIWQFDSGKFIICNEDWHAVPIKLLNDPQIDHELTCAH